MLKISFYLALGGFFGSISRFVVIKEIKKRVGYDFPIGTVIVNIIGSYLLGLLVGLGTNDTSYLLLGIGFLGAFTTFSTLAVEAVRLFSSGKKYHFFLYVFFSFIGGIVFALLGFLTGQWINHF
jgi:CrcB protein